MRYCDYDGDGVEDHIDKCLNLAGSVYGKGCPDTDGDGVYDNIDKCPDVRGDMICLGCPKKFTEEMLAVEGVSFKKNSAEMTPGQIIKLQHIVKLLRADTFLDIIIQGSSDYEGPILKDEKRSSFLPSNQIKKYTRFKEVSRTRADAVYDYLTKEGISERRITYRNVYHFLEINAGWKTKKDCVEFKLSYDPVRFIRAFTN